MKQKRYDQFYGWKMLAVLWCMYCLMQGFVMYGEPVLNTFMVIQLDFARTILGVGTTVLVISQAFAGPLVSKAIEKRGIKFTFVFGASIVLVSSILMGTIVKTPWGYWLCFGVLSGIGMAFAGMFSVQTGVNYWFREKRGLAIAIALTGSGVGGWIAGQLLNKIIVATNNYMTGWHLISVVCVLAIILALLFVVNRPEDIGQIPDGKNYDEEAEGGDEGQKGRFSRVFKLKGNEPVPKVLRDYRFWGVIIGLASLRFCYNICVSQGIIHLLDQEIPTAVAATSIGSMTLLSTVGRLVTGFFVDKIEPRICWVIGMLIFLIGVASLWQASAPWMAYLFSGGVGVGFGISYVASSALISNYFGVDTFPKLMGIVFPVQHVFGALAPITAGISYDMTGSYDIIFTLGLIFTVVGIVGIAFAKIPKKGVGELKEYRDALAH